MPTSSDGFALFHHLIWVASLSVKIPFRGCVFKESVKVCTPKSPAFSDDFAPDFAPFHVFPYRWGFRTMPISVPGHADHRFRDDGDHDSGMMAIMIPG